jgi:hypothetical protein
MPDSDQESPLFLMAFATAGTIRKHILLSLHLFSYFSNPIDLDDPFLPSINFAQKAGLYIYIKQAIHHYCWDHSLNIIQNSFIKMYSP